MKNSPIRLYFYLLLINNIFLLIIGFLALFNSLQGVIYYDGSKSLTFSIIYLFSTFLCLIFFGFGLYKLLKNENFINFVYPKIKAIIENVWFGIISILLFLLSLSQSFQGSGFFKGKVNWFIFIFILAMMYFLNIIVWVFASYYKKRGKE